MQLQDEVEVNIAATGRIVGSTFEGKPRHDIELADGRILVNVPAEFLQAKAPAAAAVPAAPTVFRWKHP